MKNAFRRVLCILLALAILLPLSISAVANEARQDYSQIDDLDFSFEDILLYYPQYLMPTAPNGTRYATDDQWAKRVWKLSQEVSNSYNYSTASFMYVCENGAFSTIFNVIAGELGLRDTLQEECAKKVALLYIHEYCTYSTYLSKAAQKGLDKSKEISKYVKDVCGGLKKFDKSSFSNVIKARFKEVTPDQISDFFSDVSDFVKACGIAIDAWKVIVQLIDLFSMQESVLEELIELFPDQESCIGKGLSLVKKDMDKGPLKYILDNFLEKQFLKDMAGQCEKFLLSLIGGANVTLVAFFADFSLKLLSAFYKGAMADDLMKMILASGCAMQADWALYRYQLSLNPSNKEYIERNNKDKILDDYITLYTFRSACIKTSTELAASFAKDQNIKENLLVYKTAFSETDSRSPLLAHANDRINYLKTALKNGENIQHVCFFSCIEHEEVHPHKAYGVCHAIVNSQGEICGKRKEITGFDFYRDDNCEVCNRSDEIYKKETWKVNDGVNLRCRQGPSTDYPEVVEGKRVNGGTILSIEKTVVNGYGSTWGYGRGYSSDYGKILE